MSRKGETQIFMLTALWVADMDFETPYFITDALKKRLEHSLYGYTVEPEKYWPTVIKWIEDHYQWKVEREWLTYIPGIVKGIGMAINALLENEDGTYSIPLLPYCNCCRFQRWWGKAS